MTDFRTMIEAAGFSSQYEVAVASGLHPSRLSLIVSGKAVAREGSYRGARSEAERLADVLNVGVDDVMGISRRLVRNRKRRERR